MMVGREEGVALPRLSACGDPTLLYDLHATTTAFVHV